MTKKRCKILGYNVDLLSFDNALDFVLNRMYRNKGLHIVTINPEIISMADKNKVLASVINSSDLVIPESVGMIIALKLKRIKQKQIPGIDFAKRLIKYCAELSYPIAMIGAREDVIVKAALNLKKEFPSLNIVFSHNGYYKNENNIIDKLVSTKPKLVLCALGACKQELFINKCLKSLDSSVYIGVGGSFDVWAGEVKRAPEIFRKTGLEWFYRTLKQPSRLKRIYKTLPMFLFRAIINSIKKD